MVTVTASLLSASNPQPVQIILTGVAAGSAYVVTGQDDQGNTWTIPGATGVSTDPANSYDFIDVRTPLNSTVTYAAVVDGVTYTSDAVTVAYAGQCVVQDLDGQNIASVNIASLTEKRTGGIRTAVFPIAGRAFPAVRVDVAVAYQYEWEFDTTDADTDTMQALLASGKPIVRRCQVGIRDFDPVIIGVATSWSDELVYSGIDVLRRWTLTVQAVDDPEPSTVRNVYTWDDFDTVMTNRTWDYIERFDASTDGWTALGGTMTWLSSGGYSTPGNVKVTTGATGAQAYIVSPTSQEIPYSAGDVWTVAAWVLAPVGKKSHMTIFWNDAANTRLAGSDIPGTGAWQQIFFTSTAPTPSGSGFTAVVETAAASTAVAGDVVQVDEITASKFVPVGTFFDLFDTWADFDSFDWATLE